MAAEGDEQPRSGSAPAVTWVDALQRAGERLLKHFLEQTAGGQAAAQEQRIAPDAEEQEPTDLQDTEPAVLAIEERKLAK